MGARLMAKAVIYHDVMRSGRSFAFRRTMILRMIATMAAIFGFPALVSLSKKLRMLGSWVRALRAAVKRARLMALLPPKTDRCLLATPLSLAWGAQPARRAAARRVRRPSSGRKACRMRAVLSPTPDLRGHDVAAGPQLGRGRDEGFDLRFDGFDLAFEKGAAVGERLPNGRGGGGGKGGVCARFLCHLESHEIDTAHRQFVQTLLILRGQLEAAQAAVPLGGEASEGLGVKAVGLGLLAERAREAAGLPGSGAMQGDPFRHQRGNQGGLAAAGRLKNDEAILQMIRESGAKERDAFGRVVEPPCFPHARVESDIKPILADVDADKV